MLYNTDNDDINSDHDYVNNAFEYTIGDYHLCKLIYIYFLNSNLKIFYY